MSDLRFRRPLNGLYRISSGYGWRRMDFHTGIDFVVPTGTPVLAAADGWAVRKIATGYGNYVIVTHVNGFSSIYAHLSQFNIPAETRVEVKAGQVIGYVGSTGRSTGPYLHFEIRVNNRCLNPRPLLPIQESVNHPTRRKGVVPHAEPV